MSCTLLRLRPDRAEALLSDDARLTSVCRVYREYSWRPQLLEARWLGGAGARRAGPQRAV